MKKTALLFLSIFLFTIVAGCARQTSTGDQTITGGEDAGEVTDLTEAEQDEVLDEFGESLLEEEEDIDIGDII